MATVTRVLPWRRHSAPTAVEIAPVVVGLPRAPSQGQHRPHRGRLRGGGGRPRPAASAVRRAVHHPPARGGEGRGRASGLDDVTIAAALLHDAVEDTGLTLADIEGQFGPEVAGIVDGVTKLDRLKFDSKEAQQAATMRKMLVAMAKDLRVLIIKLADRLHNMRTLAAVPGFKQERTAQETLDIYAPLAHRLGMQEMKQPARGSGLRRAAPQAVRRDRPHGRHPQPRARAVPHPGARGGAHPAEGAGRRRRGDRAPEAPVEHLREDGREGQGVRRHLRPRRRPGRSCPR